MVFKRITDQHNAIIQPLRIIDIMVELENEQMM